MVYIHFMQIHEPKSQIYNILERLLAKSLGTCILFENPVPIIWNSCLSTVYMKQTIAIQIQNGNEFSTAT